MLSAFTCYSNCYFTINNEGRVSKNSIFSSICFFSLKIFENYFFFGNNISFSCREHPSLSSDMQNIILPPIEVASKYSV